MALPSPSFLFLRPSFLPPFFLSFTNASPDQLVFLSPTHANTRAAGEPGVSTRGRRGFNCFEDSFVFLWAVGSVCESASRCLLCSSFSFLWVRTGGEGARCTDVGSDRCSYDGAALRDARAPVGEGSFFVFEPLFGFGLRGLVFTGRLALAGGRIDYISDPFHSASRDGQADGWSGDGTPSNEITCRATPRCRPCRIAPADPTLGSGGADPLLRRRHEQAWLVAPCLSSPMPGRSPCELDVLGTGSIILHCRAPAPIACCVFSFLPPLLFLSFFDSHRDGTGKEMAFAGWSGDGVHYIALSSAMANRSLWCIPSSLHFFFFHSVARIGLHRDGTGLRWSASGPSHKQRLTAVALLIFTLNQVLWYARALNFQHVFVGAESAREARGLPPRELDALDEIMKIVLTTCPRVSADVDVHTVRAKSFHAVAYGRYRFRLVKWLLIRRIEGGHAVGPRVVPQSEQMLDHTQSEGFEAFDPTARSSHMVVKRKGDHEIKPNPMGKKGREIWPSEASRL
ncbi:hypothetical protein C8R45DRAFT_929601 [Mycena sanguinolenta]|nr:hypothetical protein C8R45DRAFT_929601 [Mycena sanguinolenta]